MDLKFDLKFDTHTHLYFDPLHQNLRNVIADAVESGVACMLIPGIDVQSSENAISIAQVHSSDRLKIYSSAGVHPGELLGHSGSNKSSSQNQESGQGSGKNQKSAQNQDIGQMSIQTNIEKIKKLAQSEHVVAIGEIGLDKYHIFRSRGEFDQGEFNKQLKYFSAQLELAKELKMPVVIHNRQSKKELLKALNDHWDEHFRNNIVFHCCEADPELLAYAIERDIYIGVDGDVTYDKSKMNFVQKVPLERLVIETDAPFLTPEPIRSGGDPDADTAEGSKRTPNEPKYLKYILQKVAELKGQSEGVGEIGAKIYENSLQLFNLQ